MSRPERWDVIVVGAGPAGSAGARALAQRGRSVLLVERDPWPRWKVCGACLNAGTRDLAARAGAPDLERHPEARALTTLHLAADSCAAALSLTGAIALPRRVLDALLVRAAVDAGAVFEAPARATLVDDENEIGVRRLRLAGPEGARIVEASIVVAADGLDGGLGTVRSRPLRRAAGRIGIGAVFPREASGFSPGAIHMAVGRSGYVGAVRTGDGTLTVAAALDRDFVRTQGSPGAAVAALLDEAGTERLPEPPLLGWKGTPTLTRKPDRPSAHRLFAIGDAAGYVEPFTGEGMTWALATGQAVGPFVDRAIEDWDPGIEAEWAAAHRRIVSPAQRLCRGVAWSSRRPRLVRSAIGVLSRWPALAAPFVRSAGSVGYKREDSWAWT